MTRVPWICLPNFFARITSNIETQRAIALRLPLRPVGIISVQPQTQQLYGFWNSRYLLPQADSRSPALSLRSKCQGFVLHSKRNAFVALGSPGGAAVTVQRVHGW